MYYQFFYPDTEFLLCPQDIECITRDTWQDSAEGIRLVFSELEKIGHQFGEMYLQRREGIVYDPDEASMRDRWNGVQ